MFLAASSVFGARVPFLQEGVASSSWELVKLVEGEVSGVFQVEGRSGFVVEADHRFLRFDFLGRLVDLSRSAVTDDAGNEFDLIAPPDDSTPWQILHNDWLVSGIQERSLLHLEAMDQGKETDVRSALEQARRVVPLRAGSSHASSFQGVALQDSEGWKVLDLSGWNDSLWSSLEIRTETVKDREDDLWTSHGLGRRPSSPLLKRAEEGDAPALSSIGFSRRSVEFDEGFWGWVLWKGIGRWFLSGLGGQPPYAYWGGVGTFSLAHGGEDLRFRATAASGIPSEEGVVADNICPLRLADGTTLLRVYAPGTRNSRFYHNRGLDRRAYDEVGIYLVRRRSLPAEATLPGRWLPRVEGLEWGTWSYPSGRIRLDAPSEPERAFAQVPPEVAHSQHDLPRGGRLLPQSLVHAPRSITFELPVRFGQYPSSLAVDLGGSRWAFLAHEHQTPLLGVEVDPAEFREAWGGIERADATVVASMDFRMEKVLEGMPEIGILKPSLELVAGSRERSLESCTWSAPPSSWPPDPKDRDLFLRSRTRQVGILVLAKRTSPDLWMAMSREMVDGNPELAREMAHWMVYVTNELLNADTSAGRFEEVGILTDFWLDRLHPRIRDLPDPEVRKASQILTSNCLGNAVSRRDSVRSRRVVDEILGSGLESFDHGTLHYNLACYHAWRTERAPLLEATRRALDLGKPARQFREDPDFAAWLSDPGFAALLEASGN